MATRTHALWMAIGLALLPLAAEAASPGLPGLSAGSAIREITPAPGSPMSGYGDRGTRPSTGIHDRLHSRCLFLEGGDQKIALVSTDLVVFTPSLREAIRARLEGMDLDLLFLAATHTHSGPGGYQRGWALEHFLMGSYSQSLFDFLAEQIADTVRDARRRLRPVRVAYGSGWAPELSRNRRHPGGPTDPEVGLLSVVDTDGRSVALVLNFSAHPTVLGPENLSYSGDFAGLTALRLEGEVGAPVLFFNGGLGDQKPHTPGTREWEAPLAEQFREASTIAQALSAEALRVLPTLPREEVRRLRSVEHRLVLPPVDLRSRCFLYVFTPLMRRAFRQVFHEESILQALRINDFLLAGLPAEASVELTGRLKKASRARTVMIVGLANDTLGYALTPEDYGTGGYEACMSFYGKDFGNLLVEEAEATIAQVWE